MAWQGGRTPLHEAAAKGHEDVIQELYGAGAGVSEADSVRPSYPASQLQLHSQDAPQKYHNACA